MKEHVFLDKWTSELVILVNDINPYGNMCTLIETLLDIVDHNYL